MRYLNIIPMDILEQHISRWALPKEEIISWIKWDNFADIDQVVIRAEADIEFTRILNVDASVWEQKSLDDGKVVIGRDKLQIDGFVGFTSVYKLVPESERQLHFKVDFIKNEKLLKTISLSTDVIRPVIAIEMKYDRIDMSDTTAPTSPAMFRLSNNGRARATELAPFIEFTNTKTMTITIKFIKEKIPYESTVPFVLTSEHVVPKFVLKGSGDTLFTMGFKFEDAVGNEYTSELARIPILKPEKKKVEIPIESRLEGQPTIVLTPIGS